jgi:hypothetical protein
VKPRWSKAQLDKEREECFEWLEWLSPSQELNQLAQMIVLWDDALREAGLPPSARAEEVEKILKWSRRPKKRGSPRSDSSRLILPFLMHRSGKSWGEIADVFCTNKGCHLPHRADSACYDNIRKQVNKFKKALPRFYQMGIRLSGIEPGDLEESPPNGN